MQEDNKIIKRILEEPKVEVREMNIVYDGVQYGMRIPKDFAETIKESIGNIEKMKFKFTLKIPSSKSNEKPKLTGELINGKL
jgi:hypothetical protein